jgi:hypothetical protein
VFSFLKSDPTKKLKKQHTDLLGQAMQAQRNGDMRSYAKLTSEAEAVFKKIEENESSNR